MRQNIGRKAVHLAALLVLAALLCAGVQAAEQTLTMSIGTDMKIGTDPSLDSNKWSDVGGVQAYHDFTHNSPLITVDKDGNVIPWMAESYEVSDDYKTITFHLRKGIKFADGTPLNASIIKFNFERVLTFGRQEWGKKLQLNQFIYFDHCDAPDEYTVEIHFTKGWLDMPYNLATNGAYFWSFLNPADVSPAWDIKGMLKPEKMYNGLGPYYVDVNESILNQTIVLMRRHSWRDDLNFHKPKLDKIVLKVIKDSQVAVMALEKGDIDYICRQWDAPLDSLPQIEKNPDIIIKTRTAGKIYLLKTAYWEEPFNGTDGLLLRKAICYALNRTEMVEGAFNGYALPATDTMELSPQRPNVPKCCGKGYDYDLNKAKQFLAEAGWKDTDGDGILDKNGESLKDLKLVVTSDSSQIYQKDLALILQSQLKKVGINIKIQTVELAEYWEEAREGKYDLIILYNGGLPTALSLEVNSFKLEGGYKRSFYENQNGTLKTIADNISTAVNKEARDKDICQLCNILYEEAGVIPLVYEMQYAVMNKKVNGFEQGSDPFKAFLDHVEECWIED